MLRQTSVCSVSDPQGRGGGVYFAMFAQWPNIRSIVNVKEFLFFKGSVSRNQASGRPSKGKQSAINCRSLLFEKRRDSDLNRRGRTKRVSC